MVGSLWKWVPQFIWMNLFFFLFLILLMVVFIPRNWVGPSSLGLTDWRDLCALKRPPLRIRFHCLPGMVVPSKTKIVCHFSTLVLTCGQPHTLQIVPRDEYDNPTNNSASLRDEHNYSVSIHEVSSFPSSSMGSFSVILTLSPSLPLVSTLTSVLSFLHLTVPVLWGIRRLRSACR